MTLFPEVIKNFINYSILKRATEKKIIDINIFNIRDFSCDKNKCVDDYSFGGGAGMIIKAQPIYDCYLEIKNKINKKNPRVVYLTPQGKLFNQKYAKKLSNDQEIILLCGHYESIDERVIKKIVTNEISIGDYILTGGELAACVLIDSISRLIFGVLNKNISFEKESFENNLLEYAQYTRPRIFMDYSVPDVLISGNHNKINSWRLKDSFERTLIKRPDILKNKNDFFRGNIMNAILTRRSIRKYKNHDISEDQINLLLKAAMSAPSAMNSQNWEFIVIKNREHLIELSKLNPYSEMLSQAGAAIIVCGDLNKNLAKEFWIQNCSAATQNILLQANVIELGAVWIGICPFEDRMQKLSENLKLPENIKPLGIISIGIPDEFKPPSNNFDENKIHYEEFKNNK
jgi:tRNA (guanine37-N1)-methyltransferase